ncbi:hypothetical protein [Terriglobus sp. TAA 43]|uniref:hypothetical protein n=1 Tax=Terriglobus sp. TAA 43 TaxID=278961 RepID=UPI000646C50F|nr:hypothetical protein [Terriglobus sp. TAA 43]
MGLLDEVEKIAGAVVAVEGLKKVDSDPSFLTEAAAAVAGYEGTGALKDFIHKDEGEGEQKEG